MNAALPQPLPADAAADAAAELEQRVQAITQLESIVAHEPTDDQRD